MNMVCVYYEYYVLGATHSGGVNTFMSTINMVCIRSLTVAESLDIKLLYNQNITTGKCQFLSSAGAGDNTCRIHCSIDLVAQVASLYLSLHYDDYVIGSGNSGCFMNILSQLLI